MSVSAGLGDAGKAIKRALPKLLTFVGVGCTLKAVISSAQAGSRASKEKTEGLTWQEKFLKLAPHYIETGIYTTIAVVAPIAADTINSQRIAAVSAIAEAATAAYIRKDELLKKALGENKAEKKEAEDLKERGEKERPLREEEVEYTGNGNQLFEDIFGRRFRSSVAAVEKGLNAINATINVQDFSSLNDLYYRWNIPETKNDTYINVGDNIGWGINTTGLISWKIVWYELNGEPCGHIDMSMPSTKFMN